jgi:outer membrane protein OmpA-like peptidoglycan-associated protein
MEKTMRVPRLFCASLALALIANTTLAGDVRLFRHGETPDPREVAAILESFKTRSIKTRSIRLLDAAPAKRDALPTALALPVRFVFDSTQVLPESIPALEAVASGIKLAGPTTKVLIEGHTDAAGPDAYNVTLSQKRAAAVKSYLVEHGIPAENLRTIGLGESTLINPAKPMAAENRRVQFRADSDPS